MGRIITTGGPHAGHVLETPVLRYELDVKFERTFVIQFNLWRLCFVIRLEQIVQCSMLEGFSEKNTLNDSSTECIRDFDWSLVILVSGLFLCHFWSFLTWATIFGASWTLPEIGWRLKPKPSYACPNPWRTLYFKRQQINCLKTLLIPKW